MTALADGRFVVSWTDASLGTGDTSGAAIRARIFNADGTQSVPEFVVNATTVNNQTESSVTALADGRFVVSWSDQSVSTGDTSGNAIRARIFNADGTQSVPEFLVKHRHGERSAKQQRGGSGRWPLRRQLDGQQRQRRRYQ